MEEAESITEEETTIDHRETLEEEMLIDLLTWRDEIIEMIEIDLIEEEIDLILQGTTEVHHQE